jgi:hypothetical protein
MAVETCRDLAAAELVKLYRDTGIDLSGLPAIMTAEELAPAIHVTVGSLAQDRYRNRGIPFIRMGRRIRYARADVAPHLARNYSINLRD